MPWVHWVRLRVYSEGIRSPLSGASIHPGRAHVSVAEGRGHTCGRRCLPGNRPETVDVSVGGECDACFVFGQEYLVYATTAQGRIAVTGCSRTRLLADADADLRLIRSVNAKRPEGSLYGYIIHFENADPYTVTLRGNGRRYRFTGDGPYEFNFLTPGSYELTITRGKDFELRLRTRLEAQACFDAGLVRVP
jgi:hypothetical protein